jgi:hypothetical protein
MSFYLPNQNFLDKTKREYVEQVPPSDIDPQGQRLLASATR